MTEHAPSILGHALDELPVVESNMVKTSTGDTKFNVRIGHLRYEFIHSPRCKTCRIKDDHFFHDLALAVHRGTQVSKIWGAMPGWLKEQTSLDSLRNHIHYHMGELGATHSGVGNVFVSNVGVAVDAHPEVIDAETAARSIMQIGTMGVIGGTIELKASDVLGAAKMVQAIEDRSVQRDQAALFGEAARIIMESARASMSDEAYNQLVWDLQSNPRIREIMSILRDGPRDDSDDYEIDVEIEEAPRAISPSPILDPDPISIPSQTPAGIII